MSVTRGLDGRALQRDLSALIGLPQSPSARSPVLNTGDEDISPGLAKSVLALTFALRPERLRTSSTSPPTTAISLHRMRHADGTPLAALASPRASLP